MWTFLDQMEYDSKFRQGINHFFFNKTFIPEKF